LAPGAVGLLEFLKVRGFPIAIATASGKINVDFFIEKFGLLRYFREECIIYNDNTLPGKPDPALFNLALERIGVSPDRAVIFEDSRSGIQAAERARAKRVVIVNSAGGDYRGFSHQIIRHFDEFDRGMLTV
jgi:beta-phosphoglucomutase-like phosphatase (HAD superfamily)